MVPDPSLLLATVGMFASLCRLIFFLSTYIPVQHIVGKLRIRRAQWCLPTELGVGSMGRRVNRSFKSELVLLPFLT